MIAPQEFLNTLLHGVHEAVCVELECSEDLVTPVVRIFDREAEPYRSSPRKPMLSDSYQIGATMEWEGRTHYTEAVIPIQDIRATGLGGVLLKSVAKMTGVELVRMSENHEEPPPSVFDFSGALYHLKQGRAVRRNAWLPGTFITLVPGSTITVSEGRPLAAVLPVGTRVVYRYHIDMVSKDPSGEIVMFPWVQDNESMLVSDWVEFHL